jgi:ribosomal protein S18 acetylase RimI-like enzyme
VAGPDPLELNRLYVDPRWHGSGAAPALMAHAIEIAHQRGAQTLYLSVWKRNHRAIAFYARHGFEQMGSVPFPLGIDLTGSICMARPLCVASAGS